MVSNYTRKTKRGSYSKDTLKEAVRAVKNGTLSGYQASKTYGIPRMTIMDHVNNRRTKSNTLGRNTALTPDVESNLASLLHVMEKNGFGLTKSEVLEMVADYVRQNQIDTPFKNGIPGSAWFAAFKKRHQLSIKKPQAVEYARKKAVDPFIVYPYFDLLWETINDLKITNKPSAIWNMDETSFSKDPQKTKLVGLKGHAATRTISSPGRDNTTVLLGANANGDKLPPLIIYKGKNVWDAWMSSDAYPGTTYAATQNGWMETEVFERYFKQVFLPAVGDQRPILLIYDGHTTHVALNIIQAAREEGITILKLPPHTSHLLQPLDIAVMKSFKDRWDVMLVKWQRLNVGSPLPKKEFARLIGVVWTEIEGQVLKNGFRKAGIYPWDPNQISDSKFDQLQFQRWKSHQKEAARTKDPPSLLTLALNCVVTSNLPTNASLETLSQEKNDSKNKHEKSNKITILEDKIITFEELLLLQIKPGNNDKVKRRKVATGAEVITHEEVVKRKTQESIKNIKTGVQARKTKIEVKPKKNKRLKMKTKLTTKDSTATGNMELSAYETDKENSDFNSSTSTRTRLTKDGNINKNMGAKETSNKKHNTKEGVSFDRSAANENENLNSYVNEKYISFNNEKSELLCDGPSTSTGIRHITVKNENIIQKIKKEKIKPKIRKRIRVTSLDSTSVSDCLSVHSDSDIYEYSEHLIEPEYSVSQNMGILTSEIWNDNQETEVRLESNKDYDADDDQHNVLESYNIGDHVLVRYYNRKKWTYYVGFIEDMKVAEEEYYTVRFYKTVKKNNKTTLKFVLAKKVDRDNVPRISIIKKIEMTKDPLNPKELLLFNDEDGVFFS